MTVDPLPFDSVLSSTFSLSDDTLWLGTSQGLFTLQHHHSNSYHDNHLLTFSNVSQVLGSVRTLVWRSVVTGSASSSQLRPFFFHSSAKNHLQDYFACSDSQGLRWTGTYWSRRDSSAQDFGVLVVGTEKRVYFFDGSRWWFEWTSVWRNGLGGVIDGPPSAMTFGPSGELYIANNVSLTRVNINYTFDRIGPLDGLPYNQLTSLHVSTYTPLAPPPTGPAPTPSQMGTLWIGTTKGYTLFDIQSSKFRGYFNGPRWLPGSVVESITGSGAAVIVLTEEGVAVVHPEEWTLSKKARHYQAMLEKHVREPGLVADCPLLNYSSSTCSPGPTDNDGLWTSWLIASEAFRYQVTGDPTAQSNAWRFFSGLQFLVNVSGVMSVCYK